MKSKRSVVLNEDVKEYIETTAKAEGREFSAQLNFLIRQIREERAGWAERGIEAV